MKITIPQKVEEDINNAVEQFREMLIEQYERNARIEAEASINRMDGTASGNTGKATEAHAEVSGGRTDGFDLNAAWSRASSINSSTDLGAGSSTASSTDLDRPIVIGTATGDGIGPVIMEETRPILEELLSDEIASGDIEFRTIEGFTLERRLELGKTVPDDVLEQMLACDVILKGPTTTPNAAMSAAMGGKNLESANVFLRKNLDLFANVRPVRLPEEGIDWTFFRENTEGEYALGSRGVKIGDALSVDFKVTTHGGTERIARAAYEFARNNGKKRVSIVTKANIMKKTDGDFQSICLKVAGEYPEIETDCWFIDIMAANLVNRDIRNQFEVFILPNLYGDIITDEAAQIQGGVGTAGSSNIGTHHSVFEAIHGSAPRMVEEGIAHLANPASLMTASVLMLRQVAALAGPTAADGKYEMADYDGSNRPAAAADAIAGASGSAVTTADGNAGTSGNAALRESVLAKADRLEAAIRAADDRLGARMTGMPGGASCRDFAELVRREMNTRTSRLAGM